MSIKPDWNEIASRIGDDLSHDELNVAWSKECNDWLEAVSNEYGSDYHIHNSNNFSLLSKESERYVLVFSEFLERTLHRIMKTLDGIAIDEGYGKHVAIIFADIDQYYDYVLMFYPEEGVFGFSSGMYLNEGYGHFVFPTQDISYAEPIAVHELTHACLAHLSIPTWLNEGIAVLMEDVLAGNHLYLDKEIVAKHEKYWNEESIQGFWSGDSFYSSDEGQELSYNLAHVLVRNLSKDYKVFREFANDANFQDSGEAACMEHFGSSLQNYVEVFLGNGNWVPNQGLIKVLQSDTKKLRPSASTLGCS